MNFDIEIPSAKPYDAVALGLNAVDHILVVPQYPEFNSKIPYDSHALAPGGQCANAVVVLTRLGLRGRYVGKVGADNEGRLQLDSLRSEGVETRDVTVVDGAETQTAFIIVERKSGERTILWNRDDRLNIEPSEVVPEVVTSGRVLHLDGHNVEASIAAARFARTARIPTVLDIDNVYPGTERLLPLIDFLISSESFPERFTGESDLRLSLPFLARHYDCGLVAATLGDRGALAYVKGTELHSPAFQIDCKDTTGAGDAFHGGFIYGLLSGFSVERTLEFANAVAALKCRAIGSRPALPTLPEVEALIERSA
jgi:sugar/nucleoside kinase (ribokinase family)